MYSGAIKHDAVQHSCAYFSQHSALYRDKERKAGARPMETLNPHAKGMDAVKKLVEHSRKLVGLNA